MADELRLESLGYKQELTRSLTSLTNYGMTLSVVSISVGVTSLFAYGLVTGGPAVMIWSWLVVSLFTFCVALGMAEICSAYPTAGGLYFWTANLVPEKYKAMASWFTGWFNLMGLLTGIASIDFGLSMLIGSLISIANGHWSPQPWHLVLIHLLVILSHGLFNSLGPRALLWITYFSTWWQLLAPLIVTVALFSRGKGEHFTSKFLFTNFVNQTGWSSVVSRRVLLLFPSRIVLSQIYVCLIGLLPAQFCLAGYDSAAHMSEETKNADSSAPWGIIWAVAGSSILGWVFIISLLSGIHDYQNTVKTASGFPVTQILLDNFGRPWTLVLMSGLLLACWLCGLLTVTSNSRMIYAFSRDQALVLDQFSSLKRISRLSRL